MRFRLLGRSTHSEDGNVFIAIFGAIALVGILGASVMTFMKGPLATSVRLTKMNTAENQMAIGSQVAVMATANQPNNGDCETPADNFVEPIEWRSPTVEPVPTGGGLVPLSLGISKKDPWGTEYGYCVWNHGPTTSGSGCGPNMLAGTNSNIYPVVSIISAGPDKAFTTTCRDFATADVNSDGDLLDLTDLPLVSKAAETDDDILTTYTYEEATGASGGLWSIKSGSPDTAVINKKIEASGVADLKGGVLLPDKALINCADVANTGVMAKSASGIEICDGAGTWTTIGGGAANSLPTSGVCAAPADAGNIRFNNVSGFPEFCDGVMWRPFTLASNAVNLVLTPSNQNSMNVDGSNNLDLVNCTLASGYSCGAAVTFTLQNQGGITSSTIAVSMTNSTNFVKTADTCDGVTLAAMAGCTIVVKPKANGNMPYTGNLQITADNNPFAIMQGVSTGFGCVPGIQGGGGTYVACGLNDGDGAYNLVFMPSGCDGSTSNPVCSGGTDVAGIAKAWGTGPFATVSSPAYANSGTASGIAGAQQHQNLMAALTATASATLPAAQYCDDLVSGGYTDWYLPSFLEMNNYVYPQYVAGKITGFGVWYKYWTGNMGGSPNSVYYQFNPQDYNNFTRSGAFYVRCLRRDNIALPTVASDTDPDAVDVRPQVSFSSGGAATSNTVTVGGIFTPITVSMTGGTGMDIVKNGVSTGATSIASVKNGDTLAFTMNGPAVLGTKSTATINIGSDSYSWWIGYADSSKEAKVFVTSTTYKGSWLGGLAGADAICNTRAAASPYGLSSGWKAMLSDSGNDVISRVPFNWGTLKTVTGVTVVNGGFPDLWDGTLDSSISVTELGTASANDVYTGSTSTGARYGTNGSSYVVGSTDSTYYIGNWTGGSPGYGIKGRATATGSAWMEAAAEYTENQRPIYCIEDVDTVGSDTTPTAITPAYKIQVATSSRESSSAVGISGMSSGATTTLSVTATGGVPTFTVNGGAEVTSASVSNGDSIVFLMTAPATGNSSHRMTISAGGSPVGYWRVWTGDVTGTAIKRVFVMGSDVSPNFGGVAGADVSCQSAATGAALGGTWKAILSGIAESEYAINRVGYDWSELQLVDGTTVTYSGGLWDADSSPLLSPIIKTQAGVTASGQRVWTNTLSTGLAASTSNDLVYNCNNWSQGDTGNSATQYLGNSSATGVAWMSSSASQFACEPKRIFCIEQ